MIVVHNLLLNNNEMSIYTKDIEDRINTSDSSMELAHRANTGYIQAYKQLQFKHKQLEHEYGVLENEFQLYSSETFNRITSLQRDMDHLVEQKDRAFKTVSLQNKNLKEQNANLKNQINSLKMQIDKINKKSKAQQINYKNSILNFQRTQTKHKQIEINFENQLGLKINQLQNLKQILNNQRIALMSKEQLLISRDNQIAQLMAEIKSIGFQLQSQKQTEDAVKDSNYRLRKQVEQLKSMFGQMQAGLRNCEQCQILRLKNMELVAVIKGQKHNDQIGRGYSFSTSKQRTKTNQSNYQNQVSRKPSHRRYLGDVTADNIIPSSHQYTPARSMKDSVVRRCRFVLDRN